MSINTYRPAPTSPAFRAWRIVVALVIVGIGWLCGWLLMGFVFGGDSGSAAPADGASAHSGSSTVNRFDGKAGGATSATRNGKRITVDAVIENGAGKRNSSASLAPTGQHFVTVRATVTRLDDSRESGLYNPHNFVVVGSDGKEYKPSSFDPDYDWFVSGTIDEVGGSFSGAMVFPLPDGVRTMKVLAEFYPLDGLTLVATVK